MFGRMTGLYDAFLTLDVFLHRAHLGHESHAQINKETRPLLFPSPMKEQNSWQANGKYYGCHYYIKRQTDFVIFPKRVIIGEKKLISLRATALFPKTRACSEQKEKTKMGFSVLRSETDVTRKWTS